VNGAWIDIHVMVFRVITPCSDVVRYNISEAHAASIFRVNLVELG
jgi:hypothetical protein